MTDCLMGTQWLLVLKNIATRSSDKTTATLAQMLLDVLKASDDPNIGPVLDRHARALLEGTA